MGVKQKGGNDMGLFELTWYRGDDYNSYLFMHQNKTKEEFESDTKFLIIKYGKEYLDQADLWANVGDWIDYVAPKMLDLGYQWAEVERVTYSGPYEFKEAESPEFDECAHWREVVGDELFKAACAQYKKKYAEYLGGD